MKLRFLDTVQLLTPNDTEKRYRIADPNLTIPAGTELDVRGTYTEYGEKWYVVQVFSHSTPLALKESPEEFEEVGNE